MASQYTEKYGDYKIVIRESKLGIKTNYFYEIKNLEETKSIKKNPIPFPLRIAAIKIAKKDIDKIYREQIASVIGKISKNISSTKEGGSVKFL